jgi:energy-coupling factor transport system permease protein
VIPPSAISETVLQVSNLTFRYRDQPEPAIRDIGFALGRGEMLLLSGTSGCGKTTLARGGILAQIRRLAPLLVPVVIQAIVGGEEIIDAMDLRSFGVRTRTWLMKLHYRWIDAVWIILSVAVLIASFVLPILGYGKFWVPPFLLK